MPGPRDPLSGLGSAPPNPTLSPPGGPQGHLSPGIRWAGWDLLPLSPPGGPQGFPIPGIHWAGWDLFPVTSPAPSVPEIHWAGDP